MLRELHISNLAVITDARVELHGGLNCFTGATGAGKSLVIGAIELLLGLRSPSNMLRRGAEEARISGVFEINDSAALKALDAITDTNASADGGEVLLTRRLYASGRTSVTLNGSPITLAMLKQVAEHLVDVHGQHDHQYLLRPSNQLDVLDHFAGLDAQREAYRDVYTRLTELGRRLEDLRAGRSLRQQQLELYRFQAAEIDAAELDAAEFAELKARAGVLENLEKLKKDAGAAHSALYETDGAVVDRLKMMTGLLGELALLDASLNPTAQTVREATLQLEDAAFELSRYLDKLDLDPAELADVNERLNTIQRVLKKYGDDIAAALDYRAEIGRTIAELEKETGDSSSIEKQIDPLKRDLDESAKALSRKRRDAAKKLSPLIESQLTELGMEKARFAIELLDSPPSPSGIDAIEFMVRTNPGQPPQPLRKIASGGELSRIMLALKGVLAAGDRVSVLVFDEIDANVGGRLGAVIGRKLRDLAAHHQVLCITHLPQIASYADRHLTVRKVVIDDETRTSVRAMSGDERLEELAEMIGGQTITQTTRAQARELLSAATAPEVSVKRTARTRKPPAARPA